MINSLFINRLAKTISFLTNPALVVTVTVMLIVYYYADSSAVFWRASLAGIGLLVGPGLVYSVYIWQKEGAVDLDLTDRHDRIVPLMLASLGAVIGGYIVQTTFENPIFTEMSFILVTILVALTIVTTVWKISLHAATISSLTSLLVAFRGDWFALGYLVLIPVIWSRLILRQHTPNQLIAGTLLGALLTFAAAWFVGR